MRRLHSVELIATSLLSVACLARAPNACAIQNAPPTAASMLCPVEEFQAMLDRSIVEGGPCGNGFEELSMCVPGAHDTALLWVGGHENPASIQMVADDICANGAQTGDCRVGENTSVFPLNRLFVRTAPHEGSVAPDDGVYRDGTL